MTETNHTCEECKYYRPTWAENINYCVCDGQLIVFTNIERGNNCKGFEYNMEREKELR